MDLFLQALENSEPRERMLEFAYWIAEEMNIDEDEYRQVGLDGMLYQRAMATFLNV